MKKRKQDDNEVQYLSFDESPSILSRIAFVLSLLGITFPIGLILAFIEELTKNDRKKYLAHLSFVLSLIWLFFIINPFHLIDKYMEPVANVRYRILDTANIGETSNQMVMRGIANVTITVPPEYTDLIVKGYVSQSYLDEKCRELRFKKYALKPDGSFTIIMSKERYQELLQETKYDIDSHIQELSGDNNIESVEVNEKANIYTVTTLDYDFDSNKIQQGYKDCLSFLYKEGVIYNLYLGEKCDNIRVDFINKASGSVYATWNSNTDLAKLNEQEIKKVYVLPEPEGERGSIGLEPAGGDFSLRKLEISEDSDEKIGSVCLYRNGKLYFLGAKRYLPDNFSYNGQEYLIYKDAPEIVLKEGDELRLYYTTSNLTSRRLTPEGYCVEAFGRTGKVVRGRMLISGRYKNFTIKDSNNVVVENKNLNAGETYTVSWDEEGKHISLELKADFRKYKDETGPSCTQTLEDGYYLLNWSEMSTGIFSIEHSIPIQR